MLPKLFSACILIVVCISVANGAIDTQQDAYYRTMIVGTWVVADTHSTPSETTYTEDGKVFFKTLGPTEIEALATWRIAEGTLFVKVISSSDESLIPPGTVTIDTIEAMTPDKQILRCNDKRVVRLKKS